MFNLLREADLLFYDPSNNELGTLANARTDCLPNLIKGPNLMLIRNRVFNEYYVQTFTT